MSMIFNFLKKYAVIILLVLVAVSLGVFKFLKKKPKDMTDNANDVLGDLGVSNSDVTFYRDKALSIAHNLGTAYPKYDPRYWTENDKEVFEAVKDLSRAQFDIVAKLYNEVYAKGNNLSADLARLLDDDYYKQLTVR